jgi:DNA invertase Pin-like site-specific DNA recombinase
MAASALLRAVLYARYSTEKQSENSIEDQFRVCERLAERHGFQVVGRFDDPALSGGTTRRQGYQRMLEAARVGEFEIIVAEDVSRLWRAMAEQAPRLAELRDLDVHVVTQDLDTRHESADILSAVNGAMSEQYRKEIGRRTRRGLEGRARAGKSTGGKAYGHIAARDSSSGKLEIHPEQANVVLRIYQDYAHGLSPRAIAAALNREGVASPGSARKRAEPRLRPWMPSAIAGDPSRGIGILNNELYIGQVIYNRSRWVRSASDSSRRRWVENPREEWIRRSEERLRIIPQKLWDRVKARQKARSETIGGRVRKGLQATECSRPGRKPKYLFSGLVRCGVCGARYVIADRAYYACSSRVNGGESACKSDVRIKRTVVESGLIDGIRSDLLSSEILADIEQETRRSLRAQRRATATDPKRLAGAEAEVRHLVDAIASGALRGSTAVAERLATAEAELAALTVAAHPVKAADIERLVALVVDRYRAMVATLEQSLPAADIEQVRADLRALFGSITVVSDEREIRFEADLRNTHLALLKGVGGSANNVVAGACYLSIYQSCTLYGARGCTSLVHECQGSEPSHIAGFEVCDVEPRALDESTDRPVQMAATANPPPHGRQALLPPLDGGFRG